MRVKFSNEAIVAMAIISVLSILPIASTMLNQPFYISLGTRVLIFAVAAISIDFILGFAGMISLGHAAYIGIGAYSVGILSFHGIHDGFVHFGVAVLASALIALPIGASSVRTKGIHFIMISLAFGQMLYYLAISISAYGGDDGLSINAPSDFGSWLDLRSPISLYYFCFVFMVVILFVLRRIVGSRFGLILQGIKLNDQRARSIGISSFRYKLVGYVISAMVCGLAGALLANQNLFISPASMQWNRSGEILIMAILGGMGTLYGGIVGAFLYVTLEFFLSQATEHWQAIFGPIIVAIVLFAGKGLWGVLVQSRPVKG